MGNFRIVINAVGGHGDKRDLNDGDKNWGCGSMTCPDCLAREFVATMARRGNTIESATLEHWPDKDCTFSGVQWGTQRGAHGPACNNEKRDPIVDDLVTGIRHGSFKQGDKT